MSAPMGTPAFCCIAPGLRHTVGRALLGLGACRRVPWGVASCARGDEAQKLGRPPSGLNELSAPFASPWWRLCSPRARPVDEATERAAHVGVEAVGAVERVSRAFAASSVTHNAKQAASTAVEAPRAGRARKSGRRRGARGRASGRGAAQPPVQPRAPVDHGRACRCPRGGPAGGLPSVSSVPVRSSTSSTTWKHMPR